MTIQLAYEHLESVFHRPKRESWFPSNFRPTAKCSGPSKTRAGPDEHGQISAVPGGSNPTKNPPTGKLGPYQLADKKKDLEVSRSPKISRIQSMNKSESEF